MTLINHFVFEPIFWGVLLTSSFVCFVLIQLFPKLNILHGRREDHFSIQASHLTPTPRLAGVAIFSGTVIWTLLAPAGQLQFTVVLFIALLPLFVAGLKEDLGYHVSPLGRLLAAVGSSVLAIALTGAWIRGIGVPGVDVLLAFVPIGVLATILASATISHSFNLIDGLNGLSAGVGALATIGLTMISHRAGAPELAYMNMMLLACIVGFLVFNFPLGKIFLGDAGAYSLGFLLAWSAILLMSEASVVSPIALLLIFFWPLADLVLAMYRRRHKARAVSQPDRLHYHQLVMRALELSLVGRGRRRLSNPLATVIILPLAAVPVVTGVYYWNDPIGSAFALGIFTVLFFGSYVMGVRLAALRLYGRFPDRGKLGRRAPSVPPEGSVGSPAEPVTSQRGVAR